SGRVNDADDSQPVAGAMIAIGGTSIVRYAGDDGRYSISGIPVGVRTVTVRRVGYSQQSRSVTIADGAVASADFALSKSTVSLTGVVVTATGEERRKEVGNAVSTVDASTFERGAVANTQQILQGRSTGVTVLGNSGQPGAGGTIRLRGVNSISQGNRPLIYVDGVRIFNGNTPTSVSARQGVSPLNDIAASDIDRIEIVKGPAATTLYGTEASGGVIQIFTKRGREGPAAWSLEASGGVNSLGRYGPQSDPTGLFLKSCRGPGLVDALGVAFEDATCPSSGSHLQTGAISRYSLGVRGAGGGMNYALSGNFENEGGVLRVGSNKTGGIRGNFGFAPRKDLIVAINSSYQRRNTALVPDGNSANGILLNVSRGPGSNFTGSGCTAGITRCVINDTIFSASNTIRGDHFINGGTITWSPLAQLTNRLSVGLDYNTFDLSTINPFGFPRVPQGQFFQQLWNRSLLSLDYASTWKQPVGSTFSSSTSIGGQLFDSRLNSTELQADNFSGPGAPTLVSGSLRQVTDVTLQRVINAGLFFQQVIGWRDVLFVTGGVRVDGNSAFGKSFGLQTYPKISASYVVSEESFWPAPFIETLKLRAAIGDAGKAPGAFDATRTWGPIAAEGGQPGFTPSQVGNPNLGPERTREIEYGFDASAWGGRLGLVFTGFKQRTTDALVAVAYPPSLGFLNNQLENVGVLENNGLELQVSSTLRPTRWMEVDARLQYTRVKGEAVDLGGRTITIDALSRSYVREGQPLPVYSGPRVTNPREFAAPIVDSTSVRLADGGPTIGATFPTQIINPTLALTFFNRLTVEGVGEFQRGGHLLNAIGYQNAGLGIWQPCYAAQAAQRAALAGDPSKLASINALDRQRCSTRTADRDYAYWVEKSDFFKLRSLSLSYALPNGALPGARNTTIALTGRNLFLSTDYTGSDPEVADQATSIFSRRDYYVFPPYRTFLLTVRTSF
ncbi:MAG TPA: TonB-dependent receptor, partial [Gemmatimonas sp.]|nr:TonB-dependent receptor [Gemmatimonas sp.]